MTRPYKGPLRTKPLKGPERSADRIPFSGYPLRGFYLCLGILTTRKQVYKFLYANLVRHFVLLQLVLYVRLYRFLVSAYRILIAYVFDEIDKVSHDRNRASVEDELLSITDESRCDVYDNYLETTLVGLEHCPMFIKGQHTEDASVLPFIFITKT